VGQWTRAILEHHVHTRLHEREGAALSNFEETLPRGQDDAPLLLRDPLVVDFVTSADARRERDLENALVRGAAGRDRRAGGGAGVAGARRAAGDALRR
jgi:predicted nuclease of restriction endonuclease-like (RecB) superfamily